MRRKVSQGWNKDSKRWNKDSQGLTRMEQQFADSRGWSKDSKGLTRMEQGFTKTHEDGARVCKDLQRIYEDC